MKKIFLVMAALLCVASVSAQSKIKDAANYVASQKWSVGLRVGAGEQAVAECFYSDKAYIEGRLGLGIVGVQEHGLSIDFTAIHNWNCCAWDWTPSAGQWYLDAGVGASVAGNGAFAAVGVVGQAKFGIKFNKVPIRLAVDFSPAFGYHHTYAHEVKVEGEEGKVVLETKPAHGAFWKTGMLNGGISATYCF